MLLKIHFLPKIHHTHSELFLRSVPLLLQWSLAANIHLKAYYSLLFLIREPAFVDYNSICQFLQWPYLKKSFHPDVPIHDRNTLPFHLCRLSLLLHRIHSMPVL